MGPGLRRDGRIWGKPWGASEPRPILRQKTLQHDFAAEAAQIDLEIEALDRRARIVPGEATSGRAAPDKFVGEEGVDVEDRVKLGAGHFGPADAERRHARFHDVEDAARLRPHAGGRLVAERDDALGIAAGAVARFAAAGRDKATGWAAAIAGHGVAERVERGLGRRIDLRTDVRAGDRVYLVAEGAPLRQALDIAAVERDEPGLAELRRRAQFAGAERGRRPAEPGEVRFHRVEALGQRQQPGEARPLDAEPGLGHHPARILELVGHEAVSPGGEGLGRRHQRLLEVGGAASRSLTKLSSHRVIPLGHPTGSSRRAPGAGRRQRPGDARPSKGRITPWHRLCRGGGPGQAGRKSQGGGDMPIERMLSEELPARVLVARVLAEAGIEYVFGISGGHTGRIVSGLSQVQNQVRMVTVREESLAGVMAEVYGRLTRRPGVMLGQGPWVLGNGLIGTLEAFLSSSPMLLLTDFSDAPHFSLHAPYQQATGDYGSWDARRAFSGVTKHVVQALTPVAAVQATQLAIKHATAGQPGPVAVLFSMDSLTGKVEPDSQPALYPTKHYLPPPPSPADSVRVAAAAQALMS